MQIGDHFYTLPRFTMAKYSSFFRETHDTNSIMYSPHGEDQVAIFKKDSVVLFNEDYLEKVKEIVLAYENYNRGADITILIVRRPEGVE